MIVYNFHNPLSLQFKREAWVNLNPKSEVLLICSAKERVFDLPDLDYDVQSSDLLVRVASWMFKSDFKKQLRQVAKFPVGAKMDLLKVKVSKALNRTFGPSTHLQTRVDFFDVVDVHGIMRVSRCLSIKGTATEVTWD